MIRFDGAQSKAANAYYIIMRAVYYTQEQIKPLSHIYRSGGSGERNMSRARLNITTATVVQRTPRRLCYIIRAAILL